jgi:hypothetical protein
VQVCAGDLGTNSEHLERNLVEITSLAHKWGAIVLIDEADEVPWYHLLSYITEIELEVHGRIYPPLLPTCPFIIMPRYVRHAY